MISYFGKILILFGLILIGLGLFLTFSGKIPFIGKLPGDMVIEKENFKFYFPLGTCLLISLVLSLVLFLFKK